MKLIPGKLIFFLETVFLGIPVGLVCLYCAVALTWWLFESLDVSLFHDWLGVLQLLMFGLASVISIFAVIAVWRLSLAYLVRGAKALSDSPGVWWKLTMAGVVVALLGLLCLLGRWMVFSDGGLPIWLGVGIYFSFGAPLFVPAFHLRWIRRRTMLLHSS